jgi:hypothetical protein
MTGFFRGRGGFFNPWLTHYAAMQKNGYYDHQLFNVRSTQASTGVGLSASEGF